MQFDYHASEYARILFVVFINNFDTVVNAIYCYLLKYVDDTKGKSTSSLMP